MYLAYSLLTLLIFVVVSPYFVYQAIRYKKYIGSLGLRVCRKRGVKTVMINGRISLRSYPRYRLIRPFFRRVLDDVDRFCMQSEESARRLIDLGADSARVTVTGSLKFDSLEEPAATGH